MQDQNLKNKATLVSHLDCIQRHRNTATLKPIRKPNTCTKLYKDVCIQACCWLYKHYALMHKTQKQIV